jgi:hypothetical protein
MKKTKIEFTGIGESELYQKALKAFIKKAKKERVSYLQPSESASEIDNEFVRLRNGSDLLATYNHKKQRFI